MQDQSTLPAQQSVHRVGSKQKRYHQHESQQWLDFSEGLLDTQFESFQALVFEKLDTILTVRPFLRWFSRNGAKPCIQG